MALNLKYTPQILIILNGKFHPGITQATHQPPFLQSLSAEQSYRLRQTEILLTNGFYCCFLILSSLGTSWQNLSDSSAFIIEKGNTSFLFRNTFCQYKHFLTNCIQESCKRVWGRKQYLMWVLRDCPHAFYHYKININTFFPPCCLFLLPQQRISQLFDHFMILHFIHFSPYLFISKVNN